jgi:Protein of unknown function (DUF5656)
MKHFTKHLSHYTSLIGILLVGAYGLIIFNYDSALEIAIAVGLAGAYVAWGIIHHYLHRDLHASVVVEYLLIASLGLIVILSVINR